ncbi:MAG: efflux RND transporter permease subunit [Methyloglobulus sp.]|nr:efflux RND transporter permease subunit [Methyloglobulus sp.]
MWLNKLYHNHVFATLAYLLVVVLGLLAYPQLPRERAPEQQSRVVDIAVSLPGVSADDAEKLALDPIERMIRTKIKDLEFVHGMTMKGTANVSVTFKENIKPAVYERRVQELRREIQALVASDLPKGIPPVDIQEQNSTDPDVFEILVYGPGNDDNFRRQARQVQRDLQQLPGTATTTTLGLEDSELHIVFQPERLGELGIAASALTTTIQDYFKESTLGAVDIDGDEWQVRVSASEEVATNLAALPVSAGKGSVKLGEIADITRASRAIGVGGIRFRGQHAVSVSVTKLPGANTLALVEQIKAYINARNQNSAKTGVQLFLKSDQSDEIRKALDLMEQHAWSGMLLVLAVTWLMLGTRLAILTTLAVPFSLAGVFIALQVTEQSLNLSVLLGVVIVLGMLVDDAVVVIEAIGQYLSRGLAPLSATVAALREVWLPVATSSFTTMASFLPLTLMGGTLGVLMGVVPQVVCMGLLVSLVQALWILPAQAAVVVTPEPMAGKAVNTSVASKVTQPDWRRRFRHTLQKRYTRGLIRLLRAPKRTLFSVLALLGLTLAAWWFDWVGFAPEPEGASLGFTVTVEMPKSTPLARTLDKLDEIEAMLMPVFKPGEMRASSIQSGETDVNGTLRNQPRFGNLYFSLNPDSGRDAKALLPLVRERLDQQLQGVANYWLQDEADWGAPAEKDLAFSISGIDNRELDKAIVQIKAILKAIPGVHNIGVENEGGDPELKLHLNGDAIQRAGLSASTVTSALQLLTGGEVVGHFIEAGETVNIRVQAGKSQAHDIKALLQHPVIRPDGGSVQIGQLVTAELAEGTTGGHHHQFERSNTVMADLEEGGKDVLAVTRLVEDQWRQIADRHPNVKLKTAGKAEELRKNLSLLWQKFILGIGLIFLIVGAQFRSFVMPFLVLLKVPMAFAGLILGLLISREPISPNTLYGAVALAGIAVNSAILMFSAGHDRLADGMGVVHATVYAAKRRMLPILITSFTTLVGLLPLAMSNDPATVEWRPVATAIVWGVGFSTVLTLFIVPLLYRLAMGFAYRKTKTEL